VYATHSRDGNLSRREVRRAWSEGSASKLRKSSRRERPVKACLSFLEEHPENLVVLAVHLREGRARWLERSVGRADCTWSGTDDTVHPHGVEGFISRQDGSISLRNILIPVSSKPRPQPSVEASARLIRNLQLSPGVVTLLHVGPAAEMPSVKLPLDTNWTSNAIVRTGSR